MTQTMIAGTTGDSTSDDFTCNGSTVHLLVEGATTSIDPIKIETVAGMKLRLERAADVITIEWRHALAGYRTFQSTDMVLSFPTAEACTATIVT